MKKIFLIVGIGLAVLIIAVSVVLGVYLGPIVKVAMEQIGPKVTKVLVTVDGVDISLLTGSAKIKGFVLGNPDGFKAPQAISVGTMSVSMDPFSVTSKKIMVHSIKVESPEITFEGGLGSNNLTKIMSNVNSTPQNNNPASSANTTSATGTTKPAPKIEVDDFLVTGAKVHVYLPALGVKNLSLPDIHLTDLGKDNDGLAPAELIRAVLTAISNSTLKTVAASAADLAQGVQSLGKGGLGKITNSISGLFGK